MEVWLSKADGSEPTQLTHGPGRRQCAPSWSPDGQTIAFESLAADGRWAIWTIEPRTGTTRQLTAEPGESHAPSWSRDGQWILFSSDRDGARDIWRMRVDGGAKERLTHGGSGLAAVETFDGRFLVYQPATRHTHGPANAPLLAQPLVGGPPQEIVSCVMGSSFTVGRRGVYHVPCRDGASAELHVVDPATGARQLIGRLDAYQSNTPSGLTIAPDERTILYDRLVSASEDVILIQNFR
jgi:Tol biopolymer transport system component